MTHSGPSPDAWRLLVATLLLAVPWCPGWSAPAPARPPYHALVHPQNMERLRSEAPTESVRFVRSSAPGQVFLPGEAAQVTLAFRADSGTGTLAGLSLELQEIVQRQPDPASPALAGLDDFGAPDLIRPVGAALRLALPSVRLTNRTETLLVVPDLPLPERFGTYALTLNPGDSPDVADQAHRFLATLARVPAPNPAATIDNTFILGEGQFFVGQPKEKPEAALARAEIYRRLGIKGMRCELSWSESASGQVDWARTDTLFAAAEAAGIRILVTLGGTPPWTYPFAPSQTPAACPTNWDGNPYGGKADWVCDPKVDARYGQWITAFCERYWKQGHGALWGIEHYNEPWQGGGISGWAGDAARYRSLLGTIAEAARRGAPGIPIFAASSIMNTEDQLYADGTRDADALVDIFTDHYVRPPMSYGPLVAAAHGKTSMETESWMVNSEYRLPLGVCLFVATGQRHINPWHPRALFDTVPGSRERYLIPTPTVVASAAFNALTAGKPFQQIVFREHLPWLFQFGADDDPDGLLVLFGQLMNIGARAPAENPGERPWAQVEAASGGTLTFDNTDGLLTLLDLAGNTVTGSHTHVTLPLSFLPTYIRCAQGPASAAARLRRATIAGKRPVEIIPLDFDALPGHPACRLRVRVHNRLPQPVTGTLAITPPPGLTVAPAASAPLTLAPGAGQLLEFALTTNAPPPAGNAYPFAFHFASDAGTADYTETLNAAVAPRRTITIDGALEDWDGIPAIRQAAGVEKRDASELAREPWLDLRDKSPDGTFTEVRLAWDKTNLYVSARVHDPTPQFDKPRRTTANEDDWFHSAASDAIAPYRDWLAHTKGSDGRTLAEAGRSFAEVPHIYRRKPQPLLPCMGDRLQLAFDLRDDWHDLTPNTNTVPLGLTAVPDTDYEYSLYRCADGGSELWRLLAPGVPRVHDFPRQARPPAGPQTGAVDGAAHVVTQDGRTRTYEVAIPLAELAGLDPQPGAQFGFTFQVGNDLGPAITYGEGKSATKLNGLTLHPYWLATPSCGIRWTLTE